MEVILVLLVPVVLLWIGVAWTRGESLHPEAMLRRLGRSSLSALQWLWRERPERGGPGRLRRPPFRYRRQSWRYFL